MGEKKLSDRICSPCSGSIPAMSTEAIESMLVELNDKWRLGVDGKSITRRYTFKGFAKAVYLSNLCVWLADEQGHHPDIAFGWGYCQVTLTTHDINALSENDFIWAAHLDKLTD